MLLLDHAGVKADVLAIPVRCIVAAAEHGCTAVDGHATESRSLKNGIGIGIGIEIEIGIGIGIEIGLCGKDREEGQRKERRSNEETKQMHMCR